ncbi:hypothetical protein DEU34_1986 [Microbacterium sp. AG1240]|uniref:hypothetical protein n=1 Tax=Microbacterium sp. AG1240 TaxID=2183992 RepID=UPI000EB10303|nr:hypothetical protein [Microbacterium sp. AG1240]RKT33393.1 hypothetical protein DEU34_1986 [Microbacterium sp. AG1240]
MDALEGWTDFHVAMVGATAALAGLVIVASSVNIAQIVKAATITSRLAAAIAGLVLAIVVAGAALIPGIPAGAYGAVVLVSTFGAGAFQAHAAAVIARDPDPDDHARVLKSALGFVPIAAYAASGVTVFFDPSTALVIAAVGCIVAIVSAIVVSWVALVEVLR